MKVSVLVIKTLEKTTCLIEPNNSKWLEILKSYIISYLEKRFVSERDSVISFCETAKCLKKLQVLVNTFINPTYPFSWIICDSEFNEPLVEHILEPLVELVEPIPEPLAEPEPVPEPLVEPEPVPEPLAEPVPQPTTEGAVDKSTSERERLERLDRKMRELEKQIAEQKIRELEAQLQSLKEPFPQPVLESFVPVGLPTALEAEPINEVISVISASDLTLSV